MNPSCDRVAGLSPEEKRALLRRWLQEKVDESRTDYPLSHGQRALWFLHRVAPESPAYNIMFAARLRNPIDVELLRRAFQMVLDRHLALRTTYVSRQGKPVQQVQERMPVHFEMVQAIGWSEANLQARLFEAADRPFDLERGPLMRVTLFTRAADDHVLLLTFHHISIDFWCVEVLLNDLRAFYSAAKAGVSGTLPALEWQYADYVRWQAGLLASAEGERLWTYWKERLTGELPPLILPSDRPRPPVQTYRGNSYRLELDAELVGRLPVLAKTEGVTQYMLLLSAFQVLLHRYTGQDDLIVASPTAGRSRPELANVVGCLINPVALRADFSGDPTFRIYLAQVRQTVLGALAHQDFPFSLLVERLQPARDSRCLPLAQVAFVWDKLLLASPGDDALDLEPMYMEQRGATYDLTLTIVEGSRSLKAAFQYNADLFDAPTIARMAGHFITLLESIADDPDRRVSMLPLLTRAEHHQLLVEWNDTRARFPHVCAHELFEAQVEQTPEAVAVAIKGERLTYGELNRRANQLAHHLMARGIGPEVRVGLCIERSPEMVVGLLGILKSGGAYVPLDPGYPRERLAFMLDDAQALVLVTMERWRPALPESSVQVLCLDSDCEAIARELETNPAADTSPANLAYVLYTSGSTGRPKGVMVLHRSLVNYLTWCRRTYPVAEGRGAPVHSTISFDLTVTSLLLPLVAGRAAILLPEEEGIEALAAALQAERDFSLVKITPAHLEVLSRQLPPDEAGGRTRAFVIGGEALSGEQLAFWRTHTPEVRLFNEYGPTETVVGCCVYEVPGDRPLPDGAVPIGRPIANTRLYVLDSHLQPVPIGLPGELHIGGVGLARGYLGRPELTAEKFIPDPFSDDPAERIYRTGDLVRYLPDGNLEYLGRADDQVNIRGFRIEPGEIEAALGRHPGVRECAVVAREEIGGRGKRLVAYIVPAEFPAPTVGELWRFLKGTLPDFMLPSAFVVLDQLPLTPNGKVDRRALPAPETRRPALDPPFVAPRDPLERFLAQIYAEVLRLEAVGVHDNFFELGGASIRSLEVVARAEAAGLPITPSSLFEFQTIAELAAALRARAVDAPTRPTIIESLGIYLPPREVSTAEVLRGCRKPPAFDLERMTGIRTRRVAGNGEYSIQIAEKAVAECLARSRYTPEQIDLLVCCPISRCDGPNFRFTFEPSTAVRLKKRFGFEHAVAFDITNACAGMFTAIDIVDSCLKSGLIRRAMVVSGEYISHLIQTAQQEIDAFLDPRLACLTVGDAGAALILEASIDPTVGFQALELYTIGRYSDYCIAKATDGPNPGAIMLTDSIKSSAVAIPHAVMHAAHMLERGGCTPDDFQHLILHQTSETALRGVVSEIERVFPKAIACEGKVVNNLAERGNTATTTHFVALMDEIRAGRMHSGDRVLFGISGSGQTVGTALYTFDDLPERLRRFESGAPSENTSARRAPSPKWKSAPPHLLGRPGKRVRIKSVGTVAHGQVKDAGNSAIELARLAAEACLQRWSHPRSEIGLLIHAGVYREDFLCEPALASMIAGALDLNANIASQSDPKTFVFDVLNGALGFLTACHLGVQAIRAGKQKHVLVVASEIENNAAAFPDQLLGLTETGSAVLLEESPDRAARGFGHFVFKSFSDRLDAFTSFTVPDQGSTRLDFERDPRLEEYYLDGITDVVTELLEIEGLSHEQIHLVFPPQISPSFAARLSDRLGIARDRIVDIAETGKDYYTSSLAHGLQHAFDHGLVHPSDVGLLIGAGSGIQVGAATYYFGQA